MSDNTEYTHTAEITPDLAGERLDKALSVLVPALSRTRLKALMLEGMVEIEGEMITDPSASVMEGDTYTITVPAPDDPIPASEDIKLDIIHEDDDIVVINKPAGLVVHPGPGHASATLVNALIHHCGSSLSGIGGVKRPGIVHRLDKDTSGVMVAAKNDAAHRSLSEQFSAHSITRRYIAIATGCPKPLTGIISTLIIRNPHNRKKMTTSDTKGKEAVTFYNVKEILGPAGQAGASLVECTLKTGRTHQVRVHMAHIGHPLIGDQTYGRGRVPKILKDTPAGDAIARFPRQALHAAHLGFVHPKTWESLAKTGERMEFTSPMPNDMEKLVKSLKT